MKSIVERFPVGSKVKVKKHVMYKNMKTNEIESLLGFKGVVIGHDLEYGFVNCNIYGYSERSSMYSNQIKIDKEANQDGRNQNPQSS